MQIATALAIGAYVVLSKDAQHKRHSGEFLKGKSYKTPRSRTAAGRTLHAQTGE
jgi:hypothetical protein